MSTSISPRRGLVSLLAAAALTAGVLAVGSPAQADPGPPPSSMASMGDSITRGFNACGFYFDCTSRSFSTGSDSGGQQPLPADPRQEQRDQREELQPGRVRRQGRRHAGPGHRHRRAQPAVRHDPDRRQRRLHQLRRGDDLGRHLPRLHRHGAGHPQERPAQRQGRRRQHPRHQAALGGRPDQWQRPHGLVAVRHLQVDAGQPDLERRRRHANGATGYGSASSTSTPSSPQACAAYGPTCDFDGNAVFNYPFSFNQVSGWDYFHPNTAGQAALAQVSYAAGFNW